MVRQYYVDEITGISEQELRPLCHDVFGFRPPAEPWLQHVFANDAAQPLTRSDRGMFRRRWAS